MRIAARSLCVAALAVLVLAGCEGAEPNAGEDSAPAVTEAAAPTSAEPAESTAPAPATVAGPAPAPVEADPVEQAPAPAPVAPAPVAPAPAPAPAAETDPQFDTCKDAKAAGYGPYVQGVDPEYDWYRDSDHDGTNCEK